MAVLAWACLLGLFAPGSLHAQPEQASYPNFFGTAGYSFYLEDEPNLPYYYEHIMRLSAGAYLSPRWAVVGTFQHMWRYRQRLPQPSAYLIGISAQRHFQMSKNWRYYLEAGPHQGNYCACDPENQNPFPRPGIWYAGWGMGIQRRLFAHTWAEAGFVSHMILNRRALPRPVYGVNYVHLSLQIRGRDIRQ